MAAASRPAGHQHALSRDFRILTLDWQKEYNSEVNKIRWMIEQVISHFKNWTIMHTDYRRPLKTFETTISAVVGLHFYRTV